MKKGEHQLTWSQFQREIVRASSQELLNKNRDAIYRHWDQGNPVGWTIHLIKSKRKL